MNQLDFEIFCFALFSALHQSNELITAHLSEANFPSAVQIHVPVGANKHLIYCKTHF